MLYRILTEDKNRRKVTRLISKRFKGFALFSARGYWKGKAERALTIEVDTRLGRGVRALAREIKRLNKQEAVLVQRVSTESEMI